MQRNVILFADLEISTILSVSKLNSFQHLDEIFDEISRDLRSFEIRFDSKVMGRFENFRIGHACPLLVVVKWLRPLTVLSGTVYRLASSMSDHTPVLFNVLEDWNEESVVLHISFDSIRIRFTRKRQIRRSLVLSGIYGRFDARFDSNANGRFAGS